MGVQNSLNKHNFNNYCDFEGHGRYFQIILGCVVLILRLEKIKCIMHVCVYKMVLSELITKR